MRRVDELRVEVTRAVSTIRSKAAENGIGGLSREVAFLLGSHVTYQATCRRRAGAAFRFEGAEVPYVFSRYNHTWLNERTIELAIARHLLRRWVPAAFLEIGNVLGHYGITGHQVLDLYERVDGVTNGDIVTWDTDARFDAIVAISTLEHVRFDEPDKDPHGAVAALANMRRLLRPGGRLLVTVPLGYNPGLDDDVRERRFAFDRQRFYRRVSAANDWSEVGVDEALAHPYGSTYRNANAILVGVDELG